MSCEVVNMSSQYLKEFERLNTSCENIYDSCDFNVLIVLKDGTNLIGWDDVENNDDILFISEDLSDCTTLSRKYQGLRSLKAIVLRNVTDKVADASEMFRGCESLKELHFCDCDFSNVCDMSWMFRCCSDLVNLSNLNELDVSGVKWMMGMFYGCSSLEDLSALKDWDVSNVVSMSVNLLLGEEGMFCGCTSLEDLTALANWNVSNVRDMGHMFEGCKSLVDLSALANWDVSAVTTMERMFHGCLALEDISGLKNWNVSQVRDMELMFRNCNCISDVSSLANWDVSQVINMESMFRGCSSLVDVDGLANWNVSHVNNMSWMFRGCCALENISGLANWDVSNVKTMKYMFYCCASLVDISPLANWDISNALDMQYMFQNTRLKDISPVADWKVSLSHNVLGIFDVPDSSEIDISPTYDWEINLVTRRVLFRSVKMGKHIPQRSIDKAVSMYFDEYGEDNVLKIYDEDKDHHMEYLIDKLYVAFSRKSIHRVKGEIEKTFQERLNPIDISQAPKGLVLICDILIKDYGDKGIDYCMEMFEKKYPMKTDDSELVRAILVRKFANND